MKFSNEQKQYHKQVLREVAQMVQPQSSSPAAVLTVPSKETHRWAAGKVQALQTVKL